MAAQETTNKFMLIFRSVGWDKNITHEEAQKALDESMVWFEKLIQEGKVLAGQRLEDHGEIIAGGTGSMVMDGPFPESKEGVGGFVILQVETIDEAKAIARTWPVIKYVSAVEVRPVAPICSVLQRIDLPLASAAM